MCWLSGCSTSRLTKCSSSSSSFPSTVSQKPTAVHPSLCQTNAYTHFLVYKVVSAEPNPDLVPEAARAGHASCIHPCLSASLLIYLSVLVCSALFLFVCLGLPVCVSADVSSSLSGRPLHFQQSVCSSVCLSRPES